MDKKKVIKISAIIFVVIFSFAFLEVAIKAIVNKVNEYTLDKEEEKKQEEIYNSEVSKAERQIKQFIINVFNAIKEKDYNYVLVSLDEEYREFVFDNDIEKLKEYIEDNLIFVEKYEITQVNQNGGLYQVLVGLESGQEYTTKIFTVDVKNQNSCKLMLGEYTNLEKMSEKASFKDIVYELNYSYETATITSYILNVTNLSNEDMIVKVDETLQFTSNGKKYEGSIPELFTLKSNENKKIEVSFAKKKEKMSHIQLNVQEDGVVKEVKIMFAESIK